MERKGEGTFLNKIYKRNIGGRGSNEDRGGYICKMWRRIERDENQSFEKESIGKE